jgi:4-hydroxy-tetrahydrodipicolinate reductase
MTRLIIAGAKGRMGQALAHCAQSIPGVAITGQFDIGEDLRRFIAGGDVVLDFTFHESTVPLARICAEHNKAMVIGTTGHSETEQRELLQISSKIPLVLSSNFSTGVNTLFWLTRRAAEILGPDFDVEIVEMHHGLKKDAPSGTAKTLARLVADARRQAVAGLLRHGREGLTGERTRAEIGIHSLRGGDVVGDHTVIFAAAGERLELTHRASTRETFATGALRAAQWVVGKKPGIYDMQDVLGLH